MQPAMAPTTIHAMMLMATSFGFRTGRTAAAPGTQ